MIWGRLVEERIRSAQEKGTFVALPGEGRPLKLNPNPFVDASWRLTFDVLQQAGFAPYWIELDRGLREAHANAFESLEVMLQAAAGDVARIQRAIDGYYRTAAEINGRIRELNLIVPSDHFSRSPIKAEVEVKRLLTSNAT